MAGREGLGEADFGEVVVMVMVVSKESWICVRGVRLALGAARGVRGGSRGTATLGWRDRDDGAGASFFKGERFCTPVGLP